MSGWESKGEVGNGGVVKGEGEGRGEEGRRREGGDGPNERNEKYKEKYIRIEEMKEKEA